MLSKFAQVTNEGKYVKPPHAKLSYGGVSYGFISASRTQLILVRLDALYTFGVCCSLQQRMPPKGLLVWLAAVVGRLPEVMLCKPPDHQLMPSAPQRPLYPSATLQSDVKAKSAQTV